MSSRRMRARPRWTRALLIVLAIGSFSTPVVAQAGPAVSASPGLSTNVDSRGSGATLTAVDTPALRTAAAKSTRAPRVLLIGTGVARSLFPTALQSSIAGATSLDLTDAYGYGTAAASVIYQLLPAAQIRSIAVPSRDRVYSQIDMRRLAEALDYARTNRAEFDAVMLAFPPQAALDPVTSSLGRVNYGDRFGSGMSMVVEALLTNADTTIGPVAGIPEDRTLRGQMFAGANLKQRDAIERYAADALAWRSVTRSLDALTASGVAVISPSGDLTRTSGNTILPLPHQTVFGLAARPDVITVGASYTDGTRTRVSPTSGRGPTLDLGLKPDLLAPADVMAMLPGNATVSWPDDGLRVPLARIDWAASGVTPTPCPSVTNAYRCVLQGSSLVSASVVTANIAGLVAAGVPHTTGARAGNDDEILRGIAWAVASKVRAVATDSDRTAFGWEQGAGVLAGLASFNAATTPVPIARADLGQMAWGAARTVTVPLWSGAARASAAAAPIDSFIGPDPNGSALAVPYANGARISATPGTGAVSLTASGAQAQGGLYAGTLRLTPAAGDPVSVPLSLVQGVNIDFSAGYAYNHLQVAGGGERVEKATAILFVGLPPNVGLVGEAFKNISSTQFRGIGGDPTNGPIVRHATTKDSFTDPSVPASEHGRGTIVGVPPGFYKFHLITDHGVEARQARGVAESLGQRLASTGPDAANIPGANLLVPSRPGCPANADGPLGGCVARDGEVDPGTGLCRARNESARIAYAYYCGEIAFAIPSAFVSRAVHLIEHAANAANSEWDICNVDLPTDGTPIDLGAITGRADDCESGTGASSWSINAGAPGCLGPSERSRFPQGHPSDLLATFRSLVPSGAPGANLPAAVMTYRFPLPYLNTYTTAGLAFSYVADNALVGVRFKTGDGTTDDASHGLLVVDDPSINVTPLLQRAETKGTAYQQWDLMSANASVAQVSIIIIPTAFTPQGLDPTKPAASVSLCDVALRVSTYAKQAWGQPANEGGKPVQFFPVLDRGLAAKIRPGTSRVRATFDERTGGFTDRGAESESLHFAVQIPKNTTASSGAAHHVRSPRGGPAYLNAARRWGTDARRYESVLPAGYRAYDPGYGITPLRCSEGPATIGTDTDPEAVAAYEVCKGWNRARASATVLGELFEDIYANGRFAGILAVGHDAISGAQGNVAFEIADADDGGAFESRWAKAGTAYDRRFPVGDFYDDAGDSLSLSLLGGIVTVTKNTSGNYMLTVSAGTAGGLSYTISTTV